MNINNIVKCQKVKSCPKEDNNQRLFPEKESASGHVHKFYIFDHAACGGLVLWGGRKPVASLAQGWSYGGVSWEWGLTVTMLKVLTR